MFSRKLKNWKSTWGNIKEHQKLKINSTITQLKNNRLSNKKKIISLKFYYNHVCEFHILFWKKKLKKKHDIFLNENNICEYEEIIKNEL